MWGSQQLRPRLQTSRLSAVQQSPCKGARRVATGAQVAVEEVLEAPPKVLDEAYANSNPWMSGTLAPVDTEVFHRELQVVEGKLPEDLDGMYIRTGPNPQHEHWGGYHWFDGDAMVHAVHVGGGSAQAYTNHWLRTNRFITERAVGFNLWARIGDCRGAPGAAMASMYGVMSSWWLRMLSMTNMLTIGNTALVWHNGALLALSDPCMPFKLELRGGRVASVGTERFNRALQHELAPHAKLDMHTGELLCFANAMFGNLPGLPTPTAFFTVSKDGVKSPSYPVDVLCPQVMHDFVISENYAVFLDHAQVCDATVEHMTSTDEGALPFKSDSRKQCRIGLLKRSAPEEGLQWFDVPSFLYVHTATAWEEGSKVHVVLARWGHVEFDDNDNLEDSELARYTLDTATGKATETRLMCGNYLEFPTVPPHLIARTSRYCYLVEARTLTDGGTGSEAARRFDTLLKADLTAEEDQALITSLNLPANHVGGEFEFVARAPPSRAGEAAEDEGYLVGFCTDEVTMQSYLIVFDTKTMSETPVAKVEMPQRVPLGFHGTFVHGEQLLPEHLP